MNAPASVPPPTVAPPKKKDNQLSGGCLVIFFGIFFLFGAGFMTFFAMQAYRDYRAFFVYQETTCTVKDMRVVTNSSSDGNTYRAEVDFTFSVDGKTYNVSGYDGWDMSSSGYNGKQEAIAAFTRGRQYPVWYDPDDPNKAVVVRHISWAYLFALIPGIFIAVGLGGIYFGLKKKGKSSEASAYKDRAAGETGIAKWLKSDLVPDITTTPGSTLNEQLGASATELAGAVGLGCFAIIWNGIICFPINEAYQSHVKGKPEWLLTIFMVPFALAGLAMIFGFLHQLLIYMGVGKTVVEASKGRLAPGETFDLYIGQTGKMHLNKLTVKLIAEESATYRVGTSTRTDTHTVYEQTLHEEEHVEVRGGQPYEVRKQARIPADAMHSFKTSNNKLEWRIEVIGDVHRWPDFGRKFPLRVEPRAPVPDKA